VKGRLSGYRKALEATSFGLVLPSAIAIGLFLGYWLDKWLGTSPWMLIVWTLLGVASGLMSLIRGIAKYNRDVENDEDDEPV
jgi:F0F1-type ATP synthase assembly protein I